MTLRSPTSNSYISQRLRLHYVEWAAQQTEAATVLLLHGVQDHARTWDALVDSLGDQYRFIAPDLRGHGDSQWLQGAGYQTLDYVYDIAQLMRQRQPAPGPVIAHSMGGTLGAIYAGVFPERVSALVLIEGVGLHPSGFEGLDAVARVRAWIDGLHELAARQPKRYPNLPAAIERMQQANPHLSPDQADHLTAFGTHRNEDGTYSWKFDNYTHARTPYGVPDEEVTAIWRNIKCPVLIINGKQGFGHRIGQNGTDVHFQNVALFEVDDAGHWVHHDQLPTVSRLVAEFLGPHGQVARVGEGA